MASMRGDANNLDCGKYGDIHDSTDSHAKEEVKNSGKINYSRNFHVLQEDTSEKDSSDE